MIDNKWLRLYKECSKPIDKFMRSEKNVVNGLQRRYYKDGLSFRENLKTGR
jgi:hypothetical protein